MSQGFIVAGTDTGVGKTIFAAGLVAMLGARYWKPVQAGLDGETDSEVVQRLSNASRDDVIGEVYRLKSPLSPHLAAEHDGLEIDISRLALPQYRKPPALAAVTPQPATAEQSNVVALKPRGRPGLAAVAGGGTSHAPRPLVVEGAGGLLVPLNRQTLQIDLFDSWALPVILVARTSLGTINHTLMSLEALRRRNIMVQGVAFVGESSPEVEDDIATFGRIRRLGRLPWIDPLDAPTLKHTFELSFRDEDFR